MLSIELRLTLVCFLYHAFAGLTTLIDYVYFTHSLLILVTFWIYLTVTYTLAT